MLNIFRLYIMSPLAFRFCKLSKLFINCLTVLSFLVLVQCLQFVSLLDLFILKQFGLLLKVFSSIFPSLLFVVKSLIFGLGFTVNILQLFVNCTSSVIEITLDCLKTFITNLSISQSFMLLFIIKVWKHISFSVFNWFICLYVSIPCLLFRLEILHM